MAQSQGSYTRNSEASSGQMPFSGTTPAPQRTSTRRTVTDRTDKHKGILFMLGFAECALAVLLIVLATTTLCLTEVSGNYYANQYTHYDIYLTYPAQGLWGGVLVAVTGILGVCTKRNPSICMYNANMAMSIMAVSILPAVVVLSGVASASGFAVPFHILITIFSFIAMVICIVHSAYCCAGVCCGSKQYNRVVVYGPQQNQQVVRLANGQYAVLVGNTVMSQQYGYVMTTTPQAGIAVNFQPPHAEVFTQQTVPPGQGTAVQPGAYNSLSMQDSSHAYDTGNESAANPPSYSALPTN